MLIAPEKASNHLFETLKKLWARNVSQSAKSDQPFIGQTRYKVLFANSTPEFVRMIVEAEDRPISSQHFEVDGSLDVAVRAPVADQVINPLSLIIPSIYLNYHLSLVSSQYAPQDSRVSRCLNAQDFLWLSHFLANDELIHR